MVIFGLITLFWKMLLFSNSLLKLFIRGFWSTHFWLSGPTQLHPPSISNKVIYYNSKRIEQNISRLLLQRKWNRILLEWDLSIEGTIRWQHHSRFLVHWSWRSIICCILISRLRIISFPWRRTNRPLCMRLMVNPIWVGSSRFADQFCFYFEFYLCMI